MGGRFKVAMRVPSAAIALPLAILLAGCASSGSGGQTASVSDRPSPTSSPSATTGVGSAPQSAAQNPTTQTLYVANSNSDTVSVVNMARYNSLTVSGCARKWPTVAVGHNPLGVDVDQATDTIYVANARDGTVSVINGATCNAKNSSGCGQKPATVRAGAFDNSLVVDPVTNTVFVTNMDAGCAGPPGAACDRPGTVSVIDGHSCNGTHRSGCAHQPFATTKVGGAPSGVGVNPVTNTIYVANTGLDSNGAYAPPGNTLSVIDGATCKATDKPGCTPVGTVRVGAAPASLSVDPVTNTLYVANTYDATASPTGTVSVVNGATCDAANHSGCASQTPPQVPAGRDTDSAVFAQKSDTVYVTNYKDSTVSVINAARCNATQTSGCKAHPPAITVGGGPAWTVVNAALHTVYILAADANEVIVLSAK